MAVRDYFAELFVAGLFADDGWNVYFPHRDKGFDFIVSKDTREGVTVLRPVRVKGLYPTGDKKDKPTYGYIGKLTATHPDMVLAIPFFAAIREDRPTCVAYMPLSQLRADKRGYRCHPATFKSGKGTKAGLPSALQ